MNIYNNLVLFGILTCFISGIIMICIILFGNPIYPITSTSFRPNPVFDYSVLATFVGLLIFSVGIIGGE